MDVNLGFWWKSKNHYNLNLQGCMKTAPYSPLFLRLFGPWSPTGLAWSPGSSNSHPTCVTLGKLITSLSFSVFLSKNGDSKLLVFLGGLNEITHKKQILKYHWVKHLQDSLTLLLIGYFFFFFSPFENKKQLNRCRKHIVENCK